MPRGGDVSDRVKLAALRRDCVAVATEWRDAGLPSAFELPFPWINHYPMGFGSFVTEMLARGQP